MGEADDISSDATSNLFNWHKNNEGGLWLAEEGADIREIRRIQAHPWINDDSDEAAFSEDESDKSVDTPNVLRWRASLAGQDGTDNGTSLNIGELARRQVD